MCLDKVFATQPKKELIGQLYRAGHLYTQEEPIEVFDHDWKSLAEGVAIPHGLGAT